MTPEFSITKNRGLELKEMLNGINKIMQAIFAILLWGSAFHFGLIMRLGYGMIPMAADGKFLMTAAMYASFIFILIKLSYNTFTIVKEVVLIHDRRKLSVIFTIPIFIIALSMLNIPFIIVDYLNLFKYGYFQLMMISFIITGTSVYFLRKNVVLFFSIASVSGILFFYSSGTMYVDLVRDYGGGVNIFVDGEAKPRVGTIMFAVREGYIIYFPGDQFYRYLPEHRIAEISIPINM